MSRLVPRVSASAWRTCACDRAGRAGDVDRANREDAGLARAVPGEDRAGDDEERDPEGAAGGDEPYEIEALAGDPPRKRDDDTLRARAAARSTLDSSPAGHAYRFAAGGRGPVASWPPDRRADVAQQNHLVLELHPELLPRAPSCLGHQRETVGRRRPAGVLDEVRVLGRDDRAADLVALQAAELEHPPRPQLAGRVLEDGAEGALRRRLGRLPRVDELAHARADLGGVARLEPVLDAGDDLPVPERRSAGRRARARQVSASLFRPRSRRARARGSPSSRCRRRRRSSTRRPRPSPGSRRRTRSPPNPASRARCRQTAFVAPPPARSSVPSAFASASSPCETQHERVHAGVGAEHVRAEPDCDHLQPFVARPAQGLLELAERGRLGVGAGRSARADRRQARERHASAATLMRAALRRQRVRSSRAPPRRT